MNPTGYAVNSLIRPIRSLFGRLEYPVPVAQGIRGNVLEMLCELASGSAAMAGIFEIRCYFPCYLGMRGSTPMPARRPRYVSERPFRFIRAALMKPGIAGPQRAVPQSRLQVLGGVTSRRRRTPRRPAARRGTCRGTAGSAGPASWRRRRPSRTGPRCTACRPPQTTPARR
jgi:hypothetical protein